MNQHAKGLFALFWRAFVFAPIGLIGSLALLVVLGLTALAPFYALIVLIDGRYALGALVFAGWLIWLRLGGRARSFVFEASTMAAFNKTSNATPNFDSRKHLTAPSSAKRESSPAGEPVDAVHLVISP
jgi:hypothetical protein